MRNAAREEYRLAYDREGHVERREYFDGRVYRLGWKNGDLQTSLDPCERLTAYRYDLAGRIVSRKTPEGETTWKYVGRDVAAIANENGVLAYEHDETGQVIVENQLGTEIRYERDGMGRRTKQTTPWGETKYAYDANGDWIGLEHGDAQIKVERYAMGREVRRHVGTASEGQIGTFDQAFDPVGRLTGQRYRPGGKEDVAWWRHVQYDAVGNPTRIADSARGTKDYLHNAAGQLVGVLHDGKAGEFYDWDSRGNIVYEAEIDDASGVFAAVAQQMDRMGAVLAKATRRSTERRFGKGSRISESKQADKTITYLHDAAGCVVEKTVRHADGRVEAYKFEWNTLGQMVRATAPDGAVWDYRYDAKSRRTIKAAQCGEVSIFSWDGMSPLAHGATDITGRSNVTLTTSPPYELPPAFSQIIRNTEKTTVEFFLPNEVGCTHRTHNSSNISPSASIWGSRHQPFAGQLFDEETGIFYNVFRYYDSDTRRYLSPDPIGLRGGLNEYSFVSTPVAEWDPLGLITAGCDDEQIVSIDPDDIRFSQASVSGVNDIEKSMAANGWVGAPINVVRMPDGELTTFDNTRLLAASRAGVDVQAIVHEPDDPFPADRWTPKSGIQPDTWASAISARIAQQNRSYRATYPNGSPVTGSSE